MFTGIIQAVGEIAARDEHGGDCTLHVAPGALASARAGRTPAFELGESIAVNGVCLTVVGSNDGKLAFDVSAETLGLTTLGTLGIGSQVNLEAAATPQTALGGHIVSGHVDGIGEVTALEEDARSVRFYFKVPTELRRYLASKGSICVDGVSLTVNGVGSEGFDVNIVPHTMSATIFGSYAPGTRINLEVDVLARYVERLLETRETS